MKSCVEQIRVVLLVPILKIIKTVALKVKRSETGRNAKALLCDKESKSVTFRRYFSPVNGSRMTKS
ncbi:unnamed protein product [Ilex paraguariensis]|uniref:Uncharacterized protein n=1 Tax=Ilex paraguariensis TaxID=185542 RepID=A0ABC8RYI8_9AQUA